MTARLAMPRNGRWLTLFVLSTAVWGWHADQAAAFGFQDKPAQWKSGRTIPFLVNLANVPDTITRDQLLDVVRRSLAPWAAIDTATLPFVIGDVINDPDKTQPEHDGANVIFWRNTNVPRGDMYAGKAYPFTDECDILLAPQAPFTFRDVQATLMHELGHCMGLAHSSSASVMTKFQGLPALGHDDAVAVSLLYPNPTRPLEEEAATLRGRVVRSNGDPLPGAMLLLIDGTGRIALAGYSGRVDAQRRTDPSGKFELPGVPPGRYRLKLQPMDDFAAADPKGYGFSGKLPAPFRPQIIDLPALEAGDTRDLGKLTVEE